MIGRCRLCGHDADLQDSHVMPAFVYKWLKATSATGYMRAADQPNQRVQDGQTRPWLCPDCEGRFNKYETQFASDLFHPFHQNPGDRLRYGRWLLKFCVSLSWRQLLLRLEDGTLESEKPELLDAAKVALRSWAAFLLDESQHPGRFEQHLLPLGAIEQHSVKDMPANFNRYTLRVVSMNVISVAGEEMLCISKLGPLVVIGFIKVEAPNEWRGSKVHVVHGVVQPSRYEIPGVVLDYLLHGARGFEEANRKISETQAAKIRESVERDPERVANSDSFEAMLHDMELFGEQAFGEAERKS